MSENPSGTAVGFTVFAGTVMIIVGVLHAIQGLVALFNDTFYVVGQEYVFQFDVTTWGWTHLLLGILVGFAGFFIFRGAVWARTIGVIVAALSVIVNFAWLPYYPVWSLIIIALDVFVIWALTAHGRDITA
ncbi:hypothetical protein OCAE111667_09105 [Occultella aeris]|jgi:hypothetical protein|uniref:DUF7144 domain-containing protein n=1 Tax=Occultella aeris TaxID=2761496 RepID=A0A7M4DJV9_9MICO|nr:hypothetical protein [Occultella aeris]VZO37344.1 hypothetical protein HALOF300_02418 [Occultella aeris]